MTDPTTAAHAAADLRTLVAPLDPARFADDRAAAAPPVASILQRAAEPSPTSGADPKRTAATRRRVAVWGTPGVLLALGAGAIAAAALRGHSPAGVHNLVRCYTVDHVTTDTHQYTDTTEAAAAGQTAPDQSATVAGALDACSALWQIGLLTPGGLAAPSSGSGIATGSGDRPVPSLAACVLDDGRAAVFPGDAGICRHLGLAALADRPSGT